MFDSIMDIHSSRNILAILCFILLSAVAQQNSKDPIANFCRRYKHQTCIIDSKLYIDGGLVYYGTSVTNESQPESSTYSNASITPRDPRANRADTWLLWEDLNNTGTSFPKPNTNLVKASSMTILWYHC